MGPGDLENQLMRKKKLFTLVIKLCSIEHKQYAEDSREKEGYYQQLHTFLHSN